MAKPTQTVESGQGALLDTSMTERERRQMLRSIRTELARVHHELNNPLSIISGNVQLLLEIVRMTGLEEDLKGPLEDIDAASQKMADLLYRLVVLKEMIPHQPSEQA